jgi:hypothetical protein
LRGVHCASFTAPLIKHSHRALDRPAGDVVNCAAVNWHMVRSSRRARATLLLVSLLAACARERRPYGKEIIERAELREAWTTTFVWFAVVFVLFLALILVRQRRKPIPMLDELFRARELPDLAEWRRRRAEAAAARRAARVAEELERREQERGAQARATAPSAPEPAPVLLGPPTNGFGRRFRLCLLISFGAVALFSLFVGTISPKELVFLAVLVAGGSAALVAVLVSFFCAMLVTMLPWRNVGSATLTGALSAVLAMELVPWLAEPVIFATLVGAGTFLGLFVGLADQASRQPLTAVATATSTTEMPTATGGPAGSPG